MTRRRSNASLFERLKGPSSVSYRGELQRRRTKVQREARAVREHNRRRIAEARAAEREHKRHEAMLAREAEREAMRREREQIREANRLKRKLMSDERREAAREKKARAKEESRSFPTKSELARAYREGAKSLNEALERLGYSRINPANFATWRATHYKKDRSSGLWEDAVGNLWTDERLREEFAKRRNPRGSKGKFQRCVESVAARDPRAVCGAMEKKYRKNPTIYVSPSGRFKGRWAVGVPGYPVQTKKSKRGALSLARRIQQQEGGEIIERDAPAEIRPLPKWLQGNPAESASKAYRDFHGRDPQESITVSRQVHFHKHLAAAGDLRRLDGRTVEGGKFSLKWGKGDKPVLAFNEERNQLFIEGGEQSVDLPAFGIKRPHELETLGKVTGIDYFTRKDHLGSEGGTAIYRHRFRTINQDGKPVTVKILRYPDLIYRVRDQHLEFSGGSYEIKPEGIDK